MAEVRVKLGASLISFMTLSTQFNRALGWVSKLQVTESARGNRMMKKSRNAEAAGGGVPERGRHSQPRSKLLVLGYRISARGCIQVSNACNWKRTVPLAGEAEDQGLISVALPIFTVLP